MRFDLERLFENIELGAVMTLIFFSHGRHYSHLVVPFLHHIASMIPLMHDL
jgi:hypothetical protein